jgi:hypothetical protein
MSSPSSSGFFAICLVHSLVAVTCGVLMMFYLNEIAVFGHGQETARKLQGSTPHDQLLIQTSDSFAGLLLFAIGFLLFMVAFVKDRDFQVIFYQIVGSFFYLWRYFLFFFLIFGGEKKHGHKKGTTQTNSFFSFAKK